MSKYLYINNQWYYTISDKALRINPEFTENYYYDKALSFYKNNDVINAVSNLEVLVNINPSYKDAVKRLEHYRQELEGIQADVNLLRIHLFENPDDAEGRFDLADMLYVLGNTVEALSLWQELSLQDTGYWGKRARKMLARKNQDVTEDKAQEAGIQSQPQSFTVTPERRSVSYARQPGRHYRQSTNTEVVCI